MKRPAPYAAPCNPSRRPAASRASLRRLADSSWIAGIPQSIQHTCRQNSPRQPLRVDAESSFKTPAYVRASDIEGQPSVRSFDAE